MGRGYLRRTIGYAVWREDLYRSPPLLCDLCSTEVNFSGIMVNDGVFVLGRVCKHCADKLILLEWGRMTVELRHEVWQKLGGKISERAKEYWEKHEECSRAEQSGS